MPLKKLKSNTSRLKQTTLFHTLSSPQTPSCRSSTISGSKINAIESSSSDELQAREIRLSKRVRSDTPPTHLDTLSDNENHEQPLRTSSKRRRTFVTSVSSDDQEKVSLEKKPPSLPADESLCLDGCSPSRKGRRLVHRREKEKDQLTSDESENLADEVDKERM